MKTPPKAQARVRAKIVQPVPRKRRKAGDGGGPVRIVSDGVIEGLRKEYSDWVWASYVARGRTVGHLAKEIGLTRQGFTKVLRRRTKEMQFATFLRGCFLSAGGGITIAAEGWRVEVRWVVEQSNGSCLSAVSVGP